MRGSCLCLRCRNCLSPLALALSLLVTPILLAQPVRAGQDGPSFEVASIRQSAPDSRTRVEPTPGRFSAVGVTLRDLIKLAYPAGVNVRNDDQVVTSEAWMERVRFDVTAIGAPTTAATRPAPGAVAPPESSALNDLRARLRTLLTERFGLHLHHEYRPFSVYALTRVRPNAHGPQLRATSGDCANEREAARPAGAGAAGSAGAVGTAANSAAGATACGGFRFTGPGRLRAHAVTIPMIVSLLSNLPAVGRLVEDRTGLTGSFDLDLTWSADSAQGPNAGDSGDAGQPGAPALFTALREQLGLELRPTRGVVDVVVVDRATPPSDN